MCTFRTYRPILKAFREFCTRQYDSVDRKDLIDFATDCMKKGQKGKSVYNKLVVVSQLMKQNGRPKLLKAADWPSFVETVRPIYEDSALTDLFGACTPEEEMRFKFFLMSGFRDAEGRFVTWRDVDFKHSAVRVTAKPHWNFHPKNYEEREVPVPQKLIKMLQAFRPANAGPDDPVFTSATGNPDGAMLEKLKEVAFRAKLNCGHCVTTHKLANGEVRTNRCSLGPYCSRSFLHKFRHTFATRHLQDGIDIERFRAGWDTATSPRRWFTEGRAQRRYSDADQQRQPRGVCVTPSHPDHNFIHVERACSTNRAIIQVYAERNQLIKILHRNLSCAEMRCRSSQFLITHLNKCV